MEPRRCGKGEGTAFMQAGLAFAAETFPPKQLRLVVASFNRRAIHLYQKLGFVRQAQVTHLRSGQPFELMVRPSTGNNSSFATTFEFFTPLYRLIVKRSCVKATSKVNIFSGMY